MGWARPGPHNSHLTTPTWALSIAGVALLNIAVLMALNSLGPFSCAPAQSDPSGAQAQPSESTCDAGISSAERARITRVSLLGIALVLAGFVLGTYELITRVLRNKWSDAEPPTHSHTRRD